VGIDFSGMLRKMLNGEPAGPIQKPVLQKRNKLRRMFPQDVCRSIVENDFQELFGWVYRVDRWVDMPWNEPRLLVGQLWLICWFLREKLRNRKLSSGTGAHKLP
jgi:hypothetical protein